MDITEVKDNKKQYIDLLLLADEQQSMIDRYLERGIMYVLNDGGVKAECVVTDEGDGVLEIKNIATKQEFQRQGYAKKLIEFIEKTYNGKFFILQVGTGDSGLTTPFYQTCGFKEIYRIKNFFVDNYDHKIFENGRMLTDMIIMQKPISR